MVFTARGGLTYVDRLDFTRGDTMTVLRRMVWPSVLLRADDSTLSFSSRKGTDSAPRDEVIALSHRPFYGRFPLPATAVSFEVKGRDHVLLFWTARARTVLGELSKLSYEADFVAFGE
jgi:hypothetical protein